jgi:ubiquinone/menaquinone biosynthesis C-methylase UbiE
VADLEELSKRQRVVWAEGDYPDIAMKIESVAATVAEACGVASGESVLDVATGSGNAALIEARKGATVTGIDITPELLEVARKRAADESLEITFEEGDARQLPYEDAQFDQVTSVFGAMFAPDQKATAGELLRVCKPAGKVAVSAWTPEGLHGQMFATIGKHMPPPPEGFEPPILWGVEDHVRELFAGASDVTCERLPALGAVTGESAEAWIDYLERVLGPVVLAKQALEPEGKWEASRADLIELFERFNEADDGTIRADPEYLLTVATR